ncbi:acetyltransferase [Marinobacter nauticus]|uniref:acetyltransferase n=1 Tax=Marinobacter nauticus TaxID=2743 RepID=UPI002430E3C9|nr:acetyltransferase [Marinobacter nauticus]
MNTTPVASVHGHKCVLVGAGGHAKVVQELALLGGAEILGVCDPKFSTTGEQYWNGLKVLGGDEFLDETSPESVLLLNGIGMMPGNTIREKAYDRFVSMGFRFPALVHPFAWCSPLASIADGVQLMAGVVVQPGATIGKNSIVNTRSSVDHDSRIGAHCHLAPGATVCGDVQLGNSTFVGAGATIVQAVNVAPNQFIKAGSLTRSDIH